MTMEMKVTEQTKDNKTYSYNFMPSFISTDGGREIEIAFRQKDDPGVKILSLKVDAEGNANVNFKICSFLPDGRTSIVAVPVNIPNYENSAECGMWNVEC